ncbi:2-amino-3-carboxymuconate-6-semialdehyde decarboxylase [Skeletonema marinoi]|uniref:2-amino-3-carboxymuconate-6-semialdehyde decarboxylase n=1 Tax=Skeletonema marinoi TaxID=267567 RepID=A0AAD8YDR4_9STRA|nr:2-amino-3-carboxymuconate-6-semialdehyde decarboxylase [Skeletonema marinoi]
MMRLFSLVYLACAIPEAAAFSMKIIDSHLHVWASKSEAESNFPYDQPPPESLQNNATPEALIEQMDKAGVDGALIVQPINHKYDHSYVANAIKKYPHKFKGMLLHDPELSPVMAVKRLEELVLSGYVGVRFNPYLWNEGELMSADSGGGLAVYKRCAELGCPVGVMCFKGLELHYDDILALIEKSPDTQLVLDHLGFCALNEKGDEAFKQLLALSKYPNVSVKVSALFRNTGSVDSFPYDKVKAQRFQPLLEAFGSKRLMVGSDFPYVLETEGGYDGAINTVKSWLNKDDAEAVLFGTAERLFGKWGALE